MHFIHGDVVEAIEDGVEFLKISSLQNAQDLSDNYLQLGEAYSETMEYDKAIESLSKAIAANPENKTAYFERAVAYFETGDFDRAFSDYLVSNQSEPLANTQIFWICIGMNGGVVALRRRALSWLIFLLRLMVLKMFCGPSPKTLFRSQKILLTQP
jgi:tetratricopeptide (TPR) repeat protein